MILYQLAMWMEERMRLKLVLDEAEGDRQQLLARKEQVEQIMLTQASRWLVPEQTPVELDFDPDVYVPLTESFSATEEFAAASQTS
ncbi:hypothetical protein [Paenibacillus sp. HJGM_3]|uniref:hypothetical protein n=1 Tax=Paenibacillus sp. HJGM_3 TaxID=3379816 RepID=UPI00385ACC17